MEIKVTLPGGKKINAEFEDGTVVMTDQPVRYGGEGSAPTPYALFLASIGTCAGIFIQGFCAERNIPYEGITITQRLEYEATPFGSTKLGRIVLEINVPADFPEKYHKAIIKVADQCAVKKTILDPPGFEVKTVVV